MTSALDLFNIGIGPSSSHTVGPIRAARRFPLQAPHSVRSVRVELYGSLAATARGHGTLIALTLGFGRSPAAIVDDPQKPVREQRSVPYAFCNAAELLEHTDRTGLPISAVALANERAPEDVRRRLQLVWHTMQACITRKPPQEGGLPGGLHVRRRAATVKRSLDARSDRADPLYALDRLALFALAVNEENAAGAPPPATSRAPGSASTAMRSACGSPSAAARAARSHGAEGGARRRGGDQRRGGRASERHAAVVIGRTSSATNGLTRHRQP